MNNIIIKIIVIYCAWAWAYFYFAIIKNSVGVLRNTMRSSLLMKIKNEHVIDDDSVEM